MNHEVFENLSILKIEILPGDLKIFRVTVVGAGNVVKGMVDVESSPDYASGMRFM